MRFESWTTSSPSTSTGTRETSRARIRHPDLQGKGMANGLLAAVPVLVALAVLLSEAPEFLRRRRHPERAVIEVADCWHTLGPVLVLAIAGSPEPGLAEWPVFLFALLAQFAVDVAVLRRAGGSASGRDGARTAWARSRRLLSWPWRP
jgi:hypothetical protein